MLYPGLLMQRCPDSHSWIFTARRYASAVTSCCPVSVTLSVCHKSVFYLLFGTKAFFDQSYIVVKGNSVIYKTRVLPSSTFS